MNRYIHQTLLIALLLTATVAAGNWLANPYLMFDSPVIDGINRFITENYYKQLLFKPYQLRAIRPRSVVIGASQSGVAFNPEQLPQPAYNLAVGGSTSYMHHRLLQEAVASNPALESVILETPFFAFNSSDPNNKPGLDKELEHRLSMHVDGQRNHWQPLTALQEKMSSLISWDVARASLRMISKQQDVADKKRGSFVQLRNGQWQQQPPPGTSTRVLVENSWKKSLFNDWLPAPEHRYTIPDANSPALTSYRDSLRLLHAHNIRTNIVIAPMHASLFIALQESGLWTDFQQWKRLLVSVNAEVAQQMGQAPFPVFDFAIVSPQTGETLPPEKSTQRMQWFNDSMHASPAFGDIILQELVTATPSSGRLLDMATIDGQLADDVHAVARYTALHPEQQAAIRTLLLNNPSNNPRLSQ
jgi:hypothetical protein